VLVFLAALGAHVGVGGLLHLVRLHDFDWHRLGAFVEQDFATKRGVAILTTFVMTLLTTVMPGEWRAAFGVAFLALSASCASATLPILRDTAYELVELLSGAKITTQQLQAPAST
jgi:hypothetical protein